MSNLILQLSFVHLLCLQLDAKDRRSEASSCSFSPYVHCYVYFLQPEIIEYVFVNSDFRGTVHAFRLKERLHELKVCRKFHGDLLRTDRDFGNVCTDLETISSFQGYRREPLALFIL